MYLPCLALFDVQGGRKTASEAYVIGLRINDGEFGETGLIALLLLAVLIRLGAVALASSARDQGS